MSSIIPVTRAKASFSGLVERLINLKEHFVITKHGRPVAALLPYEEWEELTDAKSGGLAAVPPPADDHDAQVDAMVREIYESRARARSRRPAL